MTWLVIVLLALVIDVGVPAFIGFHLSDGSVEQAVWITSVVGLVVHTLSGRFAAKLKEHP